MGELLNKVAAVIDKALDEATPEETIPGDELSGPMRAAQEAAHLPPLSDVELKTLLGAIGWKPNPGDLAEVKAQVPVWAKAKQVFDASSGSAHEAATTAHYARFTESLAKGQVTDPGLAPPLKDDYNRRRDAAKRVLENCIGSATAAAMRIRESRIEALVAALPKVKETVLPSGVTIPAEHERQFINRALSRVWRQNPSKGVHSACYRGPETLLDMPGV